MITNGSISIPDEVFRLLDVVSFSIDYLEQEYNSVNRKINKNPCWIIYLEPKLVAYRLQALLQLLVSILMM